MNIYLEEIKSELKNEFIQNIVVDKLQRKCDEAIGSNITNILLNKQKEKHKKIILEVLEKYGYKFNSFYNDEIVDCAALDQPIITGGVLIKDVFRDDKKIILETKHGNIVVKMLAEEINDKDFLERKNSNSLIGCCHELTGEMLEKYKMTAVTSFVNLDFVKILIHSYNISEDKIVYDVSHNIIMPEDEYKEFFSPIKINEITYDEYINTEEYKAFKDYSSYELPLYSLAKKRTKNVTFKNLKKGKV